MSPRTSAPTPTNTRHRPRTEAQAQASRRNGRASRGPTTPQGKVKSRHNAVKHGLFAKVLRPPADAACDHADYDRLLEQLQADYGPRTALRAMLVETLAADMLHFRRTVELRQEAFALYNSEVPFTDRKTVDQHEDELNLLDAVVQACSRGVRFVLARDVHQPLAEHVVGLLVNMKQDMQEALEEQAAGRDLEEFMKKQVEDYQRIQPAELGMEDERVLMEVLGDDRPIPDAERPRWLLLFQSVRASKAQDLRFNQNCDAKEDRQRRRARQYFIKHGMKSAESVAKAESRARRSLKQTLGLLKAF